MKKIITGFAISVMLIQPVQANGSGYGMSQNPAVSYRNSGVDPSLADPQMNLLNPVMQQGGGMREPDAPGITNPLSIRALVQNANARVSPQQMAELGSAVQAYVDGNLSDARELFSAVTHKYGEGVATDRAYLGLAKIERAYGAYDVSRRILEAVIRKNRDYESIQLARRAYQDLEQEVNRATGDAHQRMEMSYARYQDIGWLNVFSKIRAYNEYKDAKANYEGLLISSRQFDQIFAQQNMTTPVPEAGLPEQGVDTEVPEEINDQIDDVLEPAVQTRPNIDQPMVRASDLNRTPGTFPAGDTSLPSVSEPQPTQTAATSVAQPAVTQSVQTSAVPEVPVTERIANMSMEEARAEYMAAYDALREALKNDDAAARAEAQTRYQAALEQYNLLKAQQ